MMKKTAVLVVAAVAMLATACKNNKETGNGGKSDSGNTSKVSDFKMTPEAEHELKIFRKAWKMNDPYTMVSSLNSYLTYDTMNVGLRDTLAQLYIELQLPEAALETIEEGLKLDPNDSTKLTLHVRVSQAINQPERSISSSKKLIELYPNDLTTKVVYATALLMKPETSLEGEKLLNDVISNPNSMSQTINYPTIENGRQVQKRTTARIFALLTLAQAYGGNGDSEKAISYLREILKLDPKMTLAVEMINEIRRVDKMR